MSEIVDFLTENGIEFNQKSKTIHTTCPVCGQSDKFSILKTNGYCVCYRGHCTFGKAPFHVFIALTLKITESESKKLIYGGASKGPKIDKNGLELKIKLINDEPEDQDLLEGINPIKYPEWFMEEISHEDSKEGLDYLLSRGITLEMVKKYQIYYSKTNRRVYLPVIMRGECYGYQGRAIDKVDPKDRMRNNEGFRKDTSTMFLDNLIDSNHIIIAEGPFDAMKFDLVGGNVATLGKNISARQLQLMYQYDINNIYLALDDDAATEMNDLARQFRKAGKEVYKINVPQSCIDRCLSLGKKADFGECSLEEAKTAFENATKLDTTQVLIYLRG